MPASSPAPEPIDLQPDARIALGLAEPAADGLAQRARPGRQIVRPGASGHRLVPVAEMVEAQRRQPGRPRARQQRRQAGPVRIQRIEPQRGSSRGRSGRTPARPRTAPPPSPRARRAAGRGRYTACSAPPGRAPPARRAQRQQHAAAVRRSGTAGTAAARPPAWPRPARCGTRGGRDGSCAAPRRRTASRSRAAGRRDRGRLPAPSRSRPGPQRVPGAAHPFVQGVVAGRPGAGARNERVQVDPHHRG